MNQTAALAGQRWRPSASRTALTQFADLLATLRRHFADTDCLEVMTPVLSSAAVSDRQIESFDTLLAGNHRLFLHTSPEYPMKRLLAAGTGDCYEISRVFRQGELGRYHNPEFTLLEWYRVGIDHHELMQELDRLLRKLWPGATLPPTMMLSYRDALSQACDLELDTVTVEQVQQVLLAQGHDLPRLDDNLNGWLDLLFSVCVTATFATDRFTLLTDYPADQAALARIVTDEQGRSVASRFELYYGATELANGYHELNDADEQRARFEHDLQCRARDGLVCPPLDEHLLAALAAGLPDCAGVAVGLERLLMVLHGYPHIHDVLTFPVEYA